MDDASPSYPTLVYRLYNAADELIYVGITGNPEQRFKYHWRHQPWWDEVRRSKFTVFPTEVAARQAERALIESVLPRENDCRLAQKLRCERGIPPNTTYNHRAASRPQRLVFDEFLLPPPWRSWRGWRGY